MNDGARRQTEHETLVRRYTEEVFEKANYDVIDEFAAEELEYHNPALPAAVTSPAEFRTAIEDIHEAFPDLETPIEDLLVDGKWVVTRTTERGTHEGTFGDVPPTGRSFEVEAINTYRIEDGQITGIWVQIDTMGLLRQLGLVREEAAV